MVEVKRALAMTRLLTLTGAGGRARRGWRWRWPGSLSERIRTGSGWWSWRRSLRRSWCPGGGRGLGVRGAAGAIRSPTRSSTLCATGEMLLVLDNCEHLVEAAARLVDYAPRLVPAPARPGDQPGAPGRRGRGRLAGPALSVPDARLPRRGVEALRGDPAVRRRAPRKAAGFSTHATGTRRPWREVCRPAGRHPAGHRAGGGADRGRCRRSRWREARPRPRAADGRQGGRAPAPNAAGRRWTGATSCSASRSARCSAGWRCSPADGRSRRRRRWDRARASKKETSWIFSRAGGQVLGRGPRRPKTAGSGTGCWSRSGSTRGRSWRRAGKPRGSEASAHAEYFLALAEEAEPRLVGAGDKCEWFRRAWTPSTTTSGRPSPGRWNMGETELGLRLQERYGASGAPGDITARGSRWLEGALAERRSGVAARVKALDGVGLAGHLTGGHG